MGGSWRVDHIPGFEQDLLDIRRKHYRGPRRSRAYRKYLDIVDRIKGLLREDPFCDELRDAFRCKPEGYPPQWPEADREIYMKPRFEMPGLRDRARFGRISVEVRTSSSHVILLAAYTHEEFPENIPKAHVNSRLTEARRLFP